MMITNNNNTILDNFTGKRWFDMVESWFTAELVVLLKREIEEICQYYARKRRNYNQSRLFQSLKDSLSSAQTKNTQTYLNKGLICFVAQEEETFFKEDVSTGVGTLVTFFDLLSNYLSNDNRDLCQSKDQENKFEVVDYILYDFFSKFSKEDTSKESFGDIPVRKPTFLKEVYYDQIKDSIHMVLETYFSCIFETYSKKTEKLAGYMRTLLPPGPFPKDYFSYHKNRSNSNLGDKDKTPCVFKTRTPFLQEGRESPQLMTDYNSHSYTNAKKIVEQDSITFIRQASLLHKVFSAHNYPIQGVKKPLLYDIFSLEEETDFVDVQKKSILKDHQFIESLCENLENASYMSLLDQYFAEKFPFDFYKLCKLSKKGRNLEGQTCYDLELPDALLGFYMEASLSSIKYVKILEKQDINRFLMEREERKKQYQDKDREVENWRGGSDLNENNWFPHHHLKLFAYFTLYALYFKVR